MPTMKDGKLIGFRNRGNEYLFTQGFYSGWFMEEVMKVMGLPKPSQYWAESYPVYEQVWKRSDFVKHAEWVENSLWGAF